MALSRGQLGLLVKKAYPQGGHAIGLGRVLIVLPSRTPVAEPAAVQATATRTPRVR